MFQLTEDQAQQFAEQREVKLANKIDEWLAKKRGVTWTQLDEGQRIARVREQIQAAAAYGFHAEIEHAMFCAIIADWDLGWKSHLNEPATRLVLEDSTMSNGGKLKSLHEIAEK